MTYRFRDVLATVIGAVEEERARRSCPQLYQQLDAARLAPTRELTPEELDAAEARIADRVVRRLISQVESHLLFPPERAAAELRVELLDVLRRVAERNGGDEPAA